MRKLITKILTLILLLGMVSVVTLYANEIRVDINGTRVQFDGQGPTIINGRTLVPVRGVFEELGFDVDWIQSTQTAILSNDSYEIIITIGSDVFTTNDEEFSLDVPAQIIGGRTMLPIRAVLESAGYSVGWDGVTQTVAITAGSADASRSFTPREAEIAHWITATAAVINLNNNRHDDISVQAYGRNEFRLIGLYRGNVPQSVVNFRSQALRQTWGIRNANDLRDQIDTMITRVADNAYHHTLGWDLVRIGHLIGWGYEVRFIDFNEALVLMEPAIPLLQYHFSSWDEAINCWLEGFNIWLADPPPFWNLIRRQALFNELQGIPWLFDDFLFTSYPIGTQRTQDSLHNDPIYLYMLTGQGLAPEQALDFLLIRNLPDNIIAVTSPEQLRGYWSSTHTRTTYREWYFNIDGTVARMLKNPLWDTFSYSSGTYTIGENGLAYISFNLLNSSGTPVNLTGEEDWMDGGYRQFLITPDGNRLYIISIIRESFLTYVRSQGDAFESFRQQHQ